MNKKVTIRDVAKLADVSISTVSRVVSGNAFVKKETLERVEKAIKETGYQPNYTAQALATNSTDTIGIVVDRSPEMSLNNAYFVNILDSISTHLSKHGKDILIVFSHGNDKNNQEDQNVKRLIRSHKIDGIIKLSVLENDKTLEYLSQIDLPSVVIGTPDKNQPISYVDNDNVKAMEEVVEFLIKKGHKKIAFVAGSLNYMVTKNRLKGFEFALIKNSLEIDTNSQYFIDFSIGSGYELADELARKNYDAIACTDDLIAVGISRRFSELNIKTEITGFNNTYYGQLLETPISSVDINSEMLGKEAVNLLMNAIEDSTSKNHSLVDTKLIIRG